MDEKKIQKLWAAFSTTGDINDYLRYKLLIEKDLMLEAGEDFGTYKDNGNSDQDH